MFHIFFVIQFLLETYVEQLLVLEWKPKFFLTMINLQSFFCSQESGGVKEEEYKKTCKR